MSELMKFRLINKIEGYSYLILLFVAMPMKYLLGYPLATKIAGSLHGALFVAFVYQLLKAKKAAGFTPRETALYFLLSLVPFGSFYTERVLAHKSQSAPYRAPLANDTISTKRRQG